MSRAVQLWVLARATERFDPGQERWPAGTPGVGGQWKGDGLPGVDPKQDKLKLAGRLELNDGETLLGTDKIDGERGGVRLALTSNGGRKTLRIGVGPEGYGKADRSAGVPAWDGNPSRPALSVAERDRLRDEKDALDQEYDEASPGRQAEIDERLDDIREQEENGDFNGTAKLDEYSIDRLASQIAPALAEAEEQLRAENDAFDELERLEDAGSTDDARMAELRRIARLDPDAPGYDGIVFTDGVIAGSALGDVHYRVELDALASGVLVSVGVQPKGASDDWGDGRDWRGQLSAAETKKLLRLLKQYSAVEVAAATEADTNPGDGGDRLKHFWTRDPEGLAKWAKSARPWTTLYRHLRKHMPAPMAKRVASDWFHDVFGYHAGSDLNRVAHGKPPRGERVGPG